jgi:hypothetical protein
MSLRPRPFGDECSSSPRDHSTLAMVATARLPLVNSTRHVGRARFPPFARCATDPPRSAITSEAPTSIGDA